MLPWVSGTIAHQIAVNNPWIEATICSGTALARVARRMGPIRLNVDVVHFLTEYERSRCATALHGEFASVQSIYHVEDWNLVRTLFKSCDAIHVISQYWEKGLVKAGADQERIVSLPNGVETDLFRPATPTERTKIRRLFGVAETTFTIGMFAKRSSDSSDRKGIDVFLAAMRRLQHRVQDIAAVIVGPGWSSIIGDLRTSGVRVVWRPYVEGRRGVAELYRGLDAYWITSRIEGGPATLLEAMASGVCCVSTPVGVVPEFIQSGENGIVVRQDDPDGFSASTEQLWANPSGRAKMGVSARQTIVGRADWRQTTRTAADLYSTALRHWSARTARALPVDITALRNAYSSLRQNSLDPESHPALPPALLRMVAAEEVSVWIGELLYSGESARAVKVALKALVRQPTNRPLLSALAKVLLGPNFLARVKRLRGFR